MMTPFEWRQGCVYIERARPIRGRVTIPGSKSLTNRLLLLAALASGESRLSGVLDAEDTRLMADALEQMGVSVYRHGNIWTVVSHGALTAPDAPIYVGNAGTVMRFLTPLLATLPATSVLQCSSRMKMRPLADLGDALAQLGGKLSYLERSGFPPVAVRGPMRGGSVRLPGSRSSQYVSGLLMALPRLAEESTITVSTDLVSHTYVEMTLWCLRQFGVSVYQDESPCRFRVPGNQTCRGVHLQVEPDASTASYWWALPLMVGGSIETLDVGSESTQGDAGLLDVLARMGASIERRKGLLNISQTPLHGIDVDMNSMSDVAPTLAVVATRADTPTTIRGVGHMRIKECDRITTLQTAFDQLGLHMESGRDWMRISPGKPTRSATLDPQDDHRMAMVFSLLGLAYGRIGILQPECVGKTYPGFFDDMARVVTRHPN